MKWCAAPCFSLYGIQLLDQDSLPWVHRFGLPEWWLSHHWCPESAFDLPALLCGGTNEIPGSWLMASSYFVDMVVLNPQGRMYERVRVSEKGIADGGNAGDSWVKFTALSLPTSKPWPAPTLSNWRECRAQLALSLAGVNCLGWHRTEAPKCQLLDLSSIHLIPSAKAWPDDGIPQLLNGCSWLSGPGPHTLPVHSRKSYEAERCEMNCPSLHLSL